MLEKYPKEIKLVFKNFPLPMHPFARQAAAAALAAAKQGKFWEFHHKLFEATSSGGLSEDKISDIAKNLNLNMEKFTADRKDPSVLNLISRDITEGEQAEVPGTPSLFVDGKMVKLRSAQDIDQAIESELKKKK